MEIVCHFLMLDITLSVVIRMTFLLQNLPLDYALFNEFCSGTPYPTFVHEY
jgi:hypothetical protein